MPRAVFAALLVLSVLNGSLLAQRAGGGFHGRPATQPIQSSFGGQRGLNRSVARRGEFSRGLHRGRLFGSYFIPFDDLVDYEQPDTEVVAAEPRPQTATQLTSQAPIPKSQVIEIPGVANPAAKTLPPTVFVLVSGERLETRRFLITANRLSVNIDRQQRSIPLNMVDLNATIKSNQERGVDLQIPNDRNEISVSF